MAPVDNVQQQVTGNVALTTTEAQVGATVTLASQQRVGNQALVLVTLPNVTGLAAGASVTVNIRAGATVAGAVIGSATATNSGAGAAAVGGIVAAALVPANQESVFVGALVSSGTGTAAASATAPINLTALYLD